MYKMELERFNVVIFRFMILNVLVVWSSLGRDWIVFSEGLMVFLWDWVDSVVSCFENVFFDFMNFKFM